MGSNPATPTDEHAGEGRSSDSGDRPSRRSGGLWGNQAEALAGRLGSDENSWQTGFGPTNVVLHRLSAELDLDNVSYVVEHGQIDVDHLPPERGVSHRIDYARALAPAGQADRAFVELRAAEHASPQLVRNNPRVRDTLRDLIKQRPITGSARSSELFMMAQRCRAVQ